MNEFIKLLGALVITVVIPLVLLLGIWAGIFPQSLQVGIGMLGVYSAIAIIVVGNLYMIWDDIRTKRYSRD